MGKNNGYGVVLQIDEDERLVIKPIGNTPAEEVAAIISSAKFFIENERLDKIEQALSSTITLLGKLAGSPPEEESTED